MSVKLLCLTGEGKLGSVRIIGNFEKPRVWKTGILYCIRLFVDRKKKVYELRSTFSLVHVYRTLFKQEWLMCVCVLKPFYPLHLTFSFLKQSKVKI